LSLHRAGASCKTLDRWCDDTARRGARAARRPRPADYEPWTISLKEAKAFGTKQGQRQILAKPQPFDGKIIANLVDERWAADLIQYTSQPAKVGEKLYEYVLVVQDIFTRFLWARAVVHEGRRGPRRI
jgi:hypothetical protein